MSELRWNPLLGEWVATATHRQDRTFLPPTDFCPLCPTQPDGFPTEVPEPTYEIVVFENLFPSLRPEPEPPAREWGGSNAMDLAGHGKARRERRRPAKSLALQVGAMLQRVPTSPPPPGSAQLRVPLPTRPPMHARSACA